MNEFLIFSMKFFFWSIFFTFLTILFMEAQYFFFCVLLPIYIYLGKVISLWLIDSDEKICTCFSFLFIWVNLPSNSLRKYCSINVADKWNLPCKKLFSKLNIFIFEHNLQNKYLASLDKDLRQRCSKCLSS